MSDEKEATITDEFKSYNSRLSLSKFDYDLYKDEDNKIEKIIRIKRISMPNKGEKWKIFDNDKLIFTLEGNKLNKKEKEFLRTLDGVNFLIMQGKIGIKSLNSLKINLKNKMAEDLTETKK